jgi:hypothetical protein
MSARTIKNFSNDIVRIDRKTQTISEDITLVAADTNKVFWLDNSTGKTITLPELEDGLNFKFVIADNFATDNWVIDSAEGDNIEGMLEVAGAVVVASGEDQINFVASAESKGDFVQLECNGTNWFLSGQAALSGGITVTDPS